MWMRNYNITEVKQSKSKQRKIRFRIENRRMFRLLSIQTESILAHSTQVVNRILNGMDPFNANKKEFEIVCLL